MIFTVHLLSHLRKGQHLVSPALSTLLHGTLLMRINKEACGSPLPSPVRPTNSPALAPAFACTLAPVLHTCAEPRLGSR